jgi:hypothetical protein
MAVNKRGRTDLQTEKDIEAFAAMAEKPLTAVPALIPEEPSTAPSPSPSHAAAEAPALRAAPAPAAAPAKRKAARSTPSVLAPAMADWKRRNREPKTGGINFRASESQLDLLRTAALVEEISQQKVLERLVWEVLEEKYGSGAK